MRTTTYDELRWLPAGRLFATWNGIRLTAVFLTGPRGPRGELTAREFFAISGQDIAAMNGGRAMANLDGFAVLPKSELQEQVVVFDTADLIGLLAQLEHAADGFDIAYQGGSYDGQVRWVAELPDEIMSNDQLTQPSATKERYTRTGKKTPEGYHIFRVARR